MQVRSAKVAPREKGQTPKVPAQEYVFPAPMRGWVLNDNLVMTQAGSARILDNWLPTQRGARVRGGCIEAADIGAAVLTLMTYRSGVEVLFASTATGVHDVAGTVGTLEGLGAGEWSFQQFGTSGGDFLVAVNGTDPLHFFNGSTWNPINGATVNQIAYDAETVAFTVGDTLTGGTSGATATIVSIVRTGAAEGVLKLGAITGTFQDNEALTDGSGGAAVANGTASVASSITMTGSDTDAFSAVWSHGSRLWFVEEGTLSAWYLDADTLGGTVTEFPMSGIFSQGGKLLFGARWSLDAGDGLDDKCVFVTSEGEVAIYEGSDPSSINTWQRVGLYKMPKPLGKRAFIQTGGDLLICTETGLIPLSAVRIAEAGVIEKSAVSRAIEPYWQSQAAALGGRTWEVVKAEDMGVLFVTQPSVGGNSPTALCSNLLTGAWSRITGWDVQTAAYFGGSTYFGSASGKVYQADVGGSDDGALYTVSYLGAFDALGQYGRVKTIRQMRALFETGSQMNPQVSASADYNETLPSPPSALAIPANNTWGSAIWGASVWGGGGTTVAKSEWVSIGVTGTTLAPIVQISFSSATKPVVNLVSIDAQYHVGAAVA